MLKQRVITAVILGSLIVFANFKLSNALIAVVFAGITLIAAWEWSALIGVKTLIKKLLYVVLVGVLISAIWFFANTEQENLILLVASIWWVCVVCLLALIPQIPELPDISMKVCSESEMLFRVIN